MMFNAYDMPCMRQNGTEVLPSTQTPYPVSGMMPSYPYMQPTPMFPPSPAIGTTLPTGMPAGPMVAPVPMPPPSQLPADIEAPPQTVTNVLYTPGFLRTQIGRRMRVEFLIGTGTLVDRTGTLVGVGTSYILLRLIESDDIMMCDLYSIKFATILL